MPETQSVEQAPYREPLKEERVGDYLAAIGTHEVKALLLSSMDYGVAYGKQALHSLFLNFQGYPLAYAGTRGNQFNYCKYSFEPIGAVAKARFGDGIRYELTDDGEDLGKGLAGHLLKFSLDHPAVSLHGLFGMTKTVSPTSERPPIRRLHIMEQLLELQSRDQPLSLVALARRLDLHHDIVRHQVKGMAQAGLLDLHVAPPTDKRRATYVQNDRIVDYYPSRNRRLMEQVVKTLNQLKDDQEASPTLDDIEVALRQLPRYQTKTSLRGNLTTILRDLIDQGLLKKQVFVGTQGSEIQLTSNQLEIMTATVNLVRQFQSGDREFIRTGKILGSKILSDPVAVRTLVTKAYENSPEANSVDREERFERITRFIMQHDIASTNQIIEAMNPFDITKSSVKSSLQAMRKRGLIESIRDGSENYWATVRSADDSHT